MPYEKFLSLKKPEQYLRKEVLIENIQNTDKERSDNEYAALMQKEKVKLFKNFKSRIDL